jgi:hypothetical protein
MQTAWIVKKRVDILHGVAQRGEMNRVWAVVHSVRERSNSLFVRIHIMMLPSPVYGDVLGRRFPICNRSRHSSGF